MLSLRQRNKEVGIPPAPKKPWWRRLAWGREPLERVFRRRLDAWRQTLTRRRLYWGGVPLAQAARQGLYDLQSLVWRQRLSVLLIIVATVSLLLPGGSLNAMDGFWESLFGFLPRMAMDLPHGDKVGHAMLFMLLACSCRLSWPFAPLHWPAVGLLLLGLGTEVLQQSIPGRSGTYGDVAADVIGVGLGLVLAWVLWPRFAVRPVG